ncbi:FAD-dependent oxidoreductase [Sphingobacterium sp. SGR-19]|uniref:FAD-dependent oxidoreductase n=1 Tax=Sphingobacterium sp. SGR-19 TaxID=2710886 RepID=UPI0013EB2CBD|nr:FAD-dependent oxidoreductase [Sphingobacterium sp. SGR-19]NGM63697.1 FAD-dependent oxidoreductase [Sphingobacterium sp. SGR-19]
MRKLMIKYAFLLLIVLTSITTTCANEKYDICIYGSTSAGIVAAYTAKNMGKSVVVISPDGHIGGLSSGGLGQTDIGNKNAIGGLSREFYKQLGEVYGQDESWKFEPKEAKKIFETYIQTADIPVIYNQRIKKVNKKKTQIRSVDLAHTYGSNKTTQRIEAEVFLDCTYEGDLFAMAGVSHTVGREDNSVYEETLNGYQLAAYRKQSGYHQFPDGVSPYVVPGDPSSGLLPGISSGQANPTGTGDKLVQAYNFRICLTDSTENMIPITKPEGYDPKKYELLVRLFDAQPKDRKINNYFIWSRMPNRKTDINNRGAFSTNLIGANHNWPEASFEERKKIFEEHVAHVKGLLYFYINDERVPKELQNFVKNWGYPKDEYVEHGHFTPQLYVREGRRMIGEYVMTERNCRGKEVITDPIGMAAYTMDSHNVQRIVVNGMVKNEGNVEVGKFPPYPISYRAILPKSKECTNLLVPVSLSASHIAFGSIRMEPVFMILGQSAAVAAVQAIDSKKAVQDIDYDKLRNELLDQKQILGL